MNAQQLANIKQAAAATGGQLYIDTNQNFEYSWNNYLIYMTAAVGVFSTGDRYQAWQIVKNTQSDSVKAAWDVAWTDFGEWTMWLIMFTAAPGQEGWGRVEDIVRGAYEQNINGLQNSNIQWGQNPEGPADLQGTLMAWATLKQAVVGEPVAQLHTNITMGLLRFALSDPVKLFGYVHEFIPPPK